MRQLRLSGSMSGIWKRTPVQLVRHRHTKEPGTDRLNPNHRATSGLYPIHLDVNSAMMNTVTHLEKVQVYLKSIENGDFGYIASLFSPDAVLEQLPNRIYPNGVR